MKAENSLEFNHKCINGAYVWNCFRKLLDQSIQVLRIILSVKISNSPLKNNNRVIILPIMFPIPFVSAPIRQIVDPFVRYIVHPLRTFGSVSAKPLECPRVGTEELIRRDWLEVKALLPACFIRDPKSWSDPCSDFFVIDRKGFFGEVCDVFSRVSRVCFGSVLDFLSPWDRVSDWRS